MSQRDLFGAKPVQASTGVVRIELHFHRDSPKAFLLSKTGLDKNARWIPKSRATRDDKAPSFFSMTRADALERGWL